MSIRFKIDLEFKCDKHFRNPDNFLILVGFIMSCLIYFKTNDFKNIKEIWGIITPIITLTLGYLFGNKNG